MRLFKVLQENVARRNVEVSLETTAEQLVTNADGQVCGVSMNQRGERRRIRANRAVVLTCGGFEANPEMQRQYWPEKPVLFYRVPR